MHENCCVLEDHPHKHLQENLKLIKFALLKHRRRSAMRPMIDFQKDEGCVYQESDISDLEKAE